MKIGLLSDTHSFLDERIFEHFAQCDEIWHAGDIGELAVATRLAAFKPFRAVFGNIDGRAVREQHPENQRFACQELDVWMTHIGGYPPKYNPTVRKQLRDNPPDLFICGHSHILRVMPDPTLKPNFLHMNPGAAGQEGFHTIRTVLRFEVNQKKISNLEVVELGRRGR